MSTLSPLSSRPNQTVTSPSTLQQADGKNSRMGSTSLLSKAAADVAAMSRGEMDLQQRLGSLGNNTIDMAENLIGSFAQQLFGDAGKGATISFDDVSMDMQASYAVGAQQSSGPDGVRSAAAFSLNESSHFIGKGTITTADGRKFDFEVEVQYEYAMEASASKSGSKTPAWSDGTPPRSEADPLPTVEFPDINFPGSLADLFKLFEKPLKTDVASEAKPDEQLGTLSLRLLNLVNSSKLLDTYAVPKSPVKASGQGVGETQPGGPALPSAIKPEAANAAPAAPAKPDAVIDPPVTSAS